MTNKMISNKKNLGSDLNTYTTSVYNEVVCGEDGTKKECELLHCNFSLGILNIPNYIFSAVGIRPDIVRVPLTVECASNNAFSGCDFEYVYQINECEDRIFSKQKIELQNVKCSAPISVLKNVMPGLTSESLVNINNINELLIFAKKIGETKSIIPFDFFCKLKDEDMVQYFMKYSYFKFFNKELGPYLQDVFKQPPQEQAAFFAFANALGCFTREYLVNVNNEKTEALLCHKASNLLARLVQTKTIKLGEFYKLFSNLKTCFDPNQNFYHFLSAQSGKNNFVNAKILVNNSKENKDYFLKVMQNFEKAKGFKITLDAEGHPIELPWETALNIFYHAKEYKGVTKENSMMAKIYGSHGIAQEMFYDACNVFEDAKLEGVPHHILGKPLKEINDESKLFTYEFLDKYDPKNAILGLYCSCCATLSSDFYGKYITIAGITAPDVQNIVIRNKNGTIIGKGTLFVNSKNGYAVFNDFEVEYKYRSDLDDVWLEGKITPNKLKRKEILNTFVRAIRDFKLEYDKMHPEKPLKKVSVGVGYNKLKDVCEETFQKAQPLLKVPKKYKFRDTDNQQYLLVGKNINRKKKINSQIQKNTL